MPYPGLLTELTSRTRGRVIRADSGLPAKADVDASVRTKFFEDGTTAETALYAEYHVPL
jgi:hypothetical protein